MTWWDSFRGLLGIKSRIHRRVKVLSISVELLAQMFETGYKPPRYEITEGIPVGAQILGIDYDRDRNVLRMIVEHDTFPEVPDALLPDEIYVEAQTWTEEPKK